MRLQPLEDEDDRAFSIKISAVEASALPSMTDLLDGDVQTAWSNSVAEIVRSVDDECKPFAGKRSLTMKFFFFPEADLRTCTYGVELLPPEIPADLPPVPSRMIFEKGKGGVGMSVRLHQGDREPLPTKVQPARVDVASIPACLDLESLGEGGLDVHWRIALADVVANMDSPKVVAAFKRVIRLKVDFFTDEDRLTFKHRVLPLKKTLSPAKPLGDVTMFLENTSRGLAVVDELQSFAGDMDDPEILGRQSHVTH